MSEETPEETPKKHPGGRPPKYGPELLGKAQYYIKNWEELGRAIPSNTSLALYLGVTRRTVQEWNSDEDKPEFSLMIDEIQSMQEQKLFDMGLTGDYNASIVKLALTKHGYSDKQETESTHKNPIPVTITPKDAKL